MQQEQNPDDTNKASTSPKSEGSRRSETDTPRLEQPGREASRNFEEHPPVSLCFHNVSAVSLELLLSQMLPEVAPLVAEHLRQTILLGETISHDVLLESYVDLTPYSITQIRHFRLGRGPAEETVHRVIIVRHTDEEPSVFELSLGNTNPRSVDFKIAYVHMDEERRWENVNAWGALLGIDSLSSLFSDTPPELYERDNSGYCTSLLPGDITIRTAPVADSTASREDLSTQATPAPRWTPRSIQIAAPDYGEQREVIRRLSSAISAIIVETGLLPTIDAFGGENAPLQKRLLDRASARLENEVTLEFSRLVNLGQSEDEEIDGGGDQDEFCAGIEGPFEDEREHADAGLEDDVDFSAHPLEQLPVSSHVGVDLFANELGFFRLEYFSHGQPRGSVLIHHSELYNFAVPVIGVTFLDESPSLREIATRWRVMKTLAPVGQVKIDRKELEANLFLSATTPAGKAVSADIGAHRVLMAFDPPHTVDTSQETLVDE